MAARCEGGGEMGKKVKGLEGTHWQSQYRHGYVKYRMGNIIDHVVKIL